MTNDDDLIIACLLDRDLVRERIDDWKRVVDEALEVETFGEGARLRFAHGELVARVAALAEAEHECCPFFTFVLTIGAVVTLDVTAPLEARPLVDVLLGIDEGSPPAEPS